MSIVHIDVVCTENHSQLLDETVSGRFDTEYLQDFDNMVTGCPCSIHSFDGKGTLQIDTISFDEPAILDLLHSACRGIVHVPLTID